MAQNANRVKDFTSRRRILQGLGTLGAASIAGCFGDSGDGGGSNAVDPVQDRVEVDPDDIVEGGTFRTAIGENVDTFDEVESSSATASAVHGLMYEGLITTSATGEIYPWIAESYSQEEVNDVTAADYESYMVEAEYNDNGVPQVDGQIVVRHPDNNGEGTDQFLTVNEAGDAISDGTFGMRFRFELHEGIEFHNGEELTAQNVVETYERAQGSYLSGQIYDALLDVQTDGDYTVDFYTQLPDAGFIRNTMILGIIPTESTDLPLGEHDPRQGNDPLGTGPWVFEEFEDTQYVTLSRNDNYWFDTDMKDWFDGDDDFPNAPVIEEVDISIVGDPASRTAALRAGELDMAYGLNSSTLSDFQSSENYRTAATNGAGYTFMQYPVTVEPFDDERVRRAINHFFPREQISENIFEGWENPAWIPIPPVAARLGAHDYDELTEELRDYNAYDIEEGESLIEEYVEETGYETPIDITIRTNANNDDRVATMELIIEALNQSDYFNAELDTYPDLTTAIGDWYQPDFAQEGSLAFVGLSSGFSPHGYIKSVHHPDNYLQCCNFQNIDFPELNEALQNARYGADVAQDNDLRRDRYEEIMEMTLELCGNSYGTHSTVVGVLNSNDVHGFNTYPSSQSIIPYGLHSPVDEQITYIDR